MQMKRLLLLIAVLFGIHIVLNGNPVDKETAKNIGAKFLQASTEMKNVDVNGLELVTSYKTSDGNDAFYVFNTENGFVIVAADDCATPILGYSTEGQFVTDDLPIQMQDYLNDFVEEIQYGIEHETYKDEKTIRQWELVKTTGRTNDNRDAKAVSPLLASTWGQSPYYNASCPKDANNVQAITGCVATAMGQIMRYWGYPEHGTGEHSYVHGTYGTISANFGETTYQWAQMPNALSSTSSAEQTDAVATLLYHCGVAVDMDYGPNDSGANSLLVPQAMQDYFSYTCASYDYRQHYTDEIWLKKVKASLDSHPACPVYYTGNDVNGKGGHAFVCDGYDANDNLHFNWGWKGNNNNYFPISALNPGSYRFNKRNLGIFYLRPNNETVTTSYAITATSNDATYGTVSISGTSPYSNGTEVTVNATPNAGYDFMYWTENGLIVSADAEYSFKAEYQRDLVAQFADASTLCEIVFELQDQYGSGWFSNYLSVTYANSLTEHLTLTDGFNASFTRKVADGSIISLSWIQGLYEELAQFFIMTTDDKVLYEKTDISSNYSDTYTVDLSSGTVKYYFTAATDNKWSVADNWISKVKPDVSSDVTIKAVVELDEDAAVNTLTIDRYTDLYILSNSTLTVAGPITENESGRIAIVEGGQLIQNNTGVPAYLNKSITQWTTSPDNGWHAISSAVNEVGFPDILYLTSATNNVYRYNEATTTWENCKDSGNEFSSLENGRGYLYRKNDSQALLFHGELNVGDVDYELSYTASAGNLAGFHLIGNPYSHNIYKGDKGNVYGAIPNTYLQDGFYTLSTAGGWVAGIDNETPIKPLEGILVQAKPTADGETLTMSDVTTGYVDPAGKDIEKSIAITVKDAEYSDAAYVFFKKGHGLNKIEHKNADIPMLYVINDGESFAIADMNDGTDVINLGFEAKTLGHYTIDINADGDFDYLHLIDKITGEDVDMLEEEEYTFIGSPSDSEARFVVRLNATSTGEVTESETFVYQNGNEIIVNGSGLLQVYDVTGRLVMRQEIIDNQSIDISGLPRCVYIFRLTGNNVRTQKLAINY